MEINQVIEVSKRGNEEQLAELIAQGHPVKGIVDAVGNTPLHWAASGGHVEAVILLLKHGVEVNAANKNGDTALHKAAWRGNVQVLELLLAAGGNRDLANKDNKKAIDLSKTKDVRKVLVPPVEFEEVDVDSEDGDDE